MALWDLAGKAYGVPVYRMLGGKYRDRIRLYADTPSVMDKDGFAEKLKERMNMGFTFLKMDLGINLIRNVPGALTRPPDTGRQIATGPRCIPLPGLNLRTRGSPCWPSTWPRSARRSARRSPWRPTTSAVWTSIAASGSGKALEPYQMAWLEDMVPWQYTEMLKEITDAINVPTLTGEDIYCLSGFKDLIDQHAVDMVQPDLATAGGILETKKIGDYAQERGVPMAMHFAGSPVSFMANVHCAAATENCRGPGASRRGRPLVGGPGDGHREASRTRRALLASRRRRAWESS